jgi:hypothetical protein
MQALSQLSYTPTKRAHYTERPSLCKEWKIRGFHVQISVQSARDNFDRPVASFSGGRGTPGGTEDSRINKKPGHGMDRANWFAPYAGAFFAIPRWARAQGTKIVGFRSLVFDSSRPEDGCPSRHAHSDSVKSQDPSGNPPSAAIQYLISDPETNPGRLQSRGYGRNGQESAIPGSARAPHPCAEGPRPSQSTPALHQSKAYGPCQ